MRALIKICGLSRPCDIDFVNEARPDWCGFIINFPKSHRNVTPEQVRELTARLRAEILPVGVFVDQPVEAVAALLNDRTVRIAQLHGHEDNAYIAQLRRLAPDNEIWKAFKIRMPEDLETAYVSDASLIILDNGYGTGKAFDWSLTDGFHRPYLLAGGLVPENIPEAVERLHPFGIDISSGVETDGKKDREKILAAVNAVRKEQKL